MGTPSKTRDFSYILSTNQAWEQLQIDTDLLLTIRSTADDLPGVPTAMTLNNLEIQNRGFYWIFAISGCDAQLTSEFLQKLLEVDQNNLRMKLNRCCRASHEH